MHSNLEIHLTSPLYQKHGILCTRSIDDGMSRRFPSGRIEIRYFISRVRERVGRGCRRERLTLSQAYRCRRHWHSDLVTVRRATGLQQTILDRQPFARTFFSSSLSALCFVLKQLCFYFNLPESLAR